MAEKKYFLSVVINTHNSQATLERTLKSVQSFADEIVVMDMMSQDTTLAIAKKYNCEVFTHPDVGYVEPARNAAIKKARGEWIFILDDDEEAPKKMAQIKESLTQTQTDAYFVPRSNIILGRAVETGWWPDYILRLFRKGHVEWSDQLHAVPSVSGRSEYLPENSEYAIIHHNYDSINEFIDRAVRYGMIEAKALLAQHKKADPQRAFFNELIQRYYGWKGNHDKTHGLILSYLQAIQKFTAQTQLWELEHYKELPLVKLSQVLGQAAAEARYWEAHQKVESSKGLTKLYWQVRRKLKQ